MEKQIKLSEVRTPPAVIRRLKEYTVYMKENQNVFTQSKFSNEMGVTQDEVERVLDYCYVLMKRRDNSFTDNQLTKIDFNADYIDDDADFE